MLPSAIGNLSSAKVDYSYNVKDKQKINSKLFMSVFSFRSKVLEHMQLTTWEKFYLIREVTLLRVVPLQKAFGNVKQNNVGI